MRGLFDGKNGLWIAVLLGVGALLLLSGRGEDTASQEEKRIAQVLGTMAGAGHVEVALYYASSDDGYGAEKMPTGAVVVAQGAEDLSVRLNLIRAVRTLLGLPESAVDVFVMEEGS